MPEQIPLYSDSRMAIFPLSRQEKGEGYTFTFKPYKEQKGSDHYIPEGDLERFAKTPFSRLRKTMNDTADCDLLLMDGDRQGISIEVIGTAIGHAYLEDERRKRLMSSD